MAYVFVQLDVAPPASAVSERTWGARSIDDEASRISNVWRCVLLLDAPKLRDVLNINKEGNSAETVLRSRDELSVL